MIAFSPDFALEASDCSQPMDSLDTLDSIADQETEAADLGVRIGVIAKQVLFLAQSLTARSIHDAGDYIAQRVNTLQAAQPSLDVLNQLKQLAKEAEGHYVNAM